VRVTLVLSPRRPDEERELVERLGSQLPRDRSYLAKDDFQERFGSTRDELNRVERFARDNSLMVLESSSPKRSVIVSGSVSRVSATFGTELGIYSHPRGTFRGRVGPVLLPPDIAPLVTAVLGLDNRPQARAHFRIRPGAVVGTSYTPPQVAALYDFPSLNGSGQTIGIVELGGGYSPSDVGAYFSGLGLSPPTVTPVSVDGGSNSPTGDPNGADAEVLLDIEVAGGVAPGSKILVYFAPNTDAGFVDAMSAALHGKVTPSIISISWGSAESEWTSQGIRALNQACQDAATLGVTVCAAAGDNGSSDGVDDGLAHVDFPASSPYVVGCGGTRLNGSGGSISSQVVWDDQPSGGATGGGVSDVFPPPAWQAGAGVPPSVNPGANVGRGVPDLSGDADPHTGYDVLVDGSKMVVGGTSAVAPLAAGLLALVNQGLGKPVGFLNPLLYSKTQPAFRDVTSGTNGAYRAGAGWDPCSGWGSPEGSKLLRLLG
jgi:kumamolisin